MDQIGISAVIAWVVSQLIELLKKWTALPWMNQTTETVNRIVAAILAAATAVGITMHYDPAAGTLVIAGLSLSAILTFVFQILFQWVMQKFWYKTIIKKNGV